MSATKRNTQPIRGKSIAEPKHRLWIKPNEQGTLLAIVACSLLMIAGYWWYRGGHRGELIEIDRAPPLQAKFQVDINRAEWPEMIQLPGLGEILARRITNDRNENGPFRDIDDLLRVDGIGPRTLERLRPYLFPIPKDSDWANVEDANVQAIP